MSLKLDVLLIQLINIWILFFLFKKFAWTMLTNEIKRRKALIKKLESATAEYDKMIKEAKEQSHIIIEEGKTKRDELIAYAESVWEKRKEELIQSGHLKADTILDQAKAKAVLMSQEIEKSFVDSVKVVANATIKKIFWEKKDLQDEYINNIINELKVDSK